MIFRLHHPHQDNGSLGVFVGYIALCHGYINSANVIHSLQQAKFVPENWFEPDAILISGAGRSSYLIDRRTPRQHLFYICPVDTSEVKAKKKPGYGSFLGEDIFTLTSSTIFGRPIRNDAPVAAPPVATPYPVSPLAEPGDLAISIDEIRRQLDRYVPRPAAPAPIRRIRPTRNTAMDARSNAEYRLQQDVPPDDPVADLPENEEPFQ
jgi:hypothetical protein